LLPALLTAQTARPPAPEQASALTVSQLVELSAQLQVALRENDLRQAFNLASTIANAVGPRSIPAPGPLAGEIRDLEAGFGSAAPAGKALMGNSLAVKALKVGDLSKAKFYADAALREIGALESRGNSALAIEVRHVSNLVLGTVALRDGDLFTAKQRLMDAADFPAASAFPELRGPDFSLAKALIDRGEKEAVLAYFSAVRRWWPAGTAQLDQWSAAIRGGGTPILPASSRGF